MSDIPDDFGLKGFTAVEDVQGGQTVRTVTYVSKDCDVLDDADMARDDCRPTMVVSATFGSRAESVTTIPLTAAGDIWARASTDPNGYPLCVETSTSRCDSPVILGKRLGDVLITLTMPGGFTESDMVDDPPWTGTHIKRVRSVYLFDEASGESDGVAGFIPRAIRVTEEFPWFRGQPFGPVVAVSDDGEHQLRAQHDGEGFSLLTTGMDGGRRPEMPLTEQGAGNPPRPKTPLGVVWSRIESTAQTRSTGAAGDWIVAGFVDPEVFEIEILNAGRASLWNVSSEQLQSVGTARPGDLSGRFRHRFFVTPLDGTVSLYRGVEISLRDLAGHELHRYRYYDWAGLESVGEDDGGG